MCAYVRIFILNAPHGFIKLIRAKRQSACAYDANACVSAQLSSTNRLANTGRMHPTTANRLILWLMNWQRTNWRTQHFNALYVWQCKWETHAHKHSFPPISVHCIGIPLQRIRCHSSGRFAIHRLGALLDDTAFGLMPAVTDRPSGFARTHFLSTTGRVLKRRKHTAMHI